MKVKKVLAFLLIFILQSCYVPKFDCIDKKACKLYEKKLDSLSGFLFYGKVLSDNSEKPFSSFFEELTGEMSEADYSYSGQNPPTINDFIRSSVIVGAFYFTL